MSEKAGRNTTSLIGGMQAFEMPSKDKEAKMATTAEHPDRTGADRVDWNTEHLVAPGYRLV